jgi:hypothetical protein
MFYKNETAPRQILGALISPGETKLAVHIAGSGTKVFDHVTGARTEIPGAEHPCWYDDNHLIYMQVYDDGYRILDADIYLRPVEGGWFQNITADFDGAAMYPSVSRDGKIAFATPEGKIYLTGIELLKP